MNIELAPEEYWIECTYDDAMLYCFSLNIDGKTGWRLPLAIEQNFYDFSSSWCSDVDYRYLDLEWNCIPVRDII